MSRSLLQSLVNVVPLDLDDEVKDEVKTIRRNTCGDFPQSLKTYAHVLTFETMRLL